MCQVEKEAKGKGKPGGSTTKQKVHKQAKGKGKAGGSTTEQDEMQAFRLEEVRWKCEGIREQVEELGIKVGSLEQKFETTMDDIGNYFEGRLQELHQEFNSKMKKLANTAEKGKGSVENKGKGPVEKKGMTPVKVKEEDDNSEDEEEEESD
ncbi:hypothetical protein C2845_PM01G43170 [Panicum miliaceum]|uniref:Uncharacterized protein n=1 Tax=Panicum miliaceum TaxID=4540 RepID=A0A3L6TTN8_PANMI|nr:hypothetical protein C2845_PM01G43170 [Panicum miliaceum]